MEAKCSFDTPNDGRFVSAQVCDAELQKAKNVAGKNHQDTVMMMMKAESTLAAAVLSTVVDEHRRRQTWIHQLLASVAAFVVNVVSTFPAAFLRVAEEEARKVKAPREITEQARTNDIVEQPLKTIIGTHPVLISSDNHDPAALKRTLQQLDQLIKACDASCGWSFLTHTPGFWTSPPGPYSSQWSSNTTFPAYHTLDFHSTIGDLRLIPIPSPAIAKRVYNHVRKIFKQRLGYIECSARENKVDKHNDFSNYCSCISEWREEQVASNELVNQVIEALMLEEASNYLCCHPPSSHHSTSLSRRPTKENLPAYSNPIQLISDRDTYVVALIQALLASKHSVMISTCYVNYQDCAQLYILFDLLPCICRQRGVKVFFLMDQMVFESNMLKSAFRLERDASAADKTQTSKRDATAVSFFRKLPPGSPTPNHAYKSFESQHRFFEMLSKLSFDPASNFKMRFWSARDSKGGCRIKNHSKGIVVDDQWALFGGSNLTPTVLTATTDLDCMIIGEAAKAIGDTFWKLWDAMGCSATGTARPVTKRNPKLAPEYFGVSKNALVEPCTLSILQSTPTSAGIDLILEAVLEQVDVAQNSITVSMGHCCLPESFVDALERAVSRGVESIQILVNSHHSNDLRGGQRDLFLSIRELLKRVPSAKVYATEPTNHRPPDFLHSKYVIVDGRWSAIGSWNLWTRSAFYEIELEALIDCKEVASMLSAKFEKDRHENAVPVSLEDCIPGGRFCPKGCSLCRGFGPFFEN